MLLGLISDTHGFLRSEVFGHFEDVDRVLHAGDVGPPELLTELEVIAPVTAVWGNTDGSELRQRLPEIAELELEGRRIVVVHGHQLGSPKPDGLRRAHPDADVIVYGHTHWARVDERDGRLTVNPGAAGHARFRTKPSVALLTLAPDARPEVRIIRLTP